MKITDWVGRTEEVTDIISATPYAALSGLFDRSPERPPAGTPLPPLWHWLYFLSIHRRSELAPDGHAKRGGFIPPIALPRRMWAGSRFEFRRPLCVGDTLTRHSTILDVSEKEGRKGPLVFVRVLHEYLLTGESDPALVEFHDIVYRGKPLPGETAPGVKAPIEAPWEKNVVPDDVLLFRYSALTLNSHRIHYDWRYTTEHEGYPGLIVHGPLLATLLLELLREHHPEAELADFEFRALRPLFAPHPFVLCGAPQADGKTVRLWVVDHEGNLGMEATASLR